jgi:hypothetical protein
MVLKIMEGIGGKLREAPPEDRLAVSEAARRRLSWLLSDPDEYGYSPRKLVTPEHRALLEGLVTGAVFGFHAGGEE